jgi:hypothetical protein
MGRLVTICRRLLNLHRIAHGYGMHPTICLVLPSIQNREPPDLWMASVNLLPSSRSVSSRVRPESDDMDVSVLTNILTLASHSTL